MHIEKKIIFYVQKPTFANPKSASFTEPLTSTNMLAHLISLGGKKKDKTELCKKVVNGGGRNVLIYCIFKNILVEYQNVCSFQIFQYLYNLYIKSNPILNVDGE